MRPYVSKRFFWAATRCWPYAKVDTLWDALMSLGAWARAAPGQPAAAAPQRRPATLMKSRRVQGAVMVVRYRDSSVSVVDRASGTVHSGTASVNRTMAQTR